MKFALQLKEAVSETWCEKLRKVMDHAEKRQMVFEIVGAEFVNRYFSDMANEPMLLEAPQMEPHVRKHLRTDALSFMNHQLVKTVEELGIDTSGELQGGDRGGRKRGGGGGTSSELVKFMEETRERFQTGMDRHLLLGDRVSF